MSRVGKKRAPAGGGEHSTYLYDRDGEVGVGPENFSLGEESLVFWGEPEGGQPVSKLHMHPNSGPGTGYRESPSDHDVEYHESEGYYNVVVAPNNIYFYGNVKKRDSGMPNYRIRINRKNAFKKQ